MVALSVIRKEKISHILYSIAKTKTICRVGGKKGTVNNPSLQLLAFFLLSNIHSVLIIYQFIRTSTPSFMPKGIS